MTNEDDVRAVPLPPMSLLVLGTMAFDAIETPFGSVDKTVGGAATFISLAASYFYQPIHNVSVVGDDFPAETLAELNRRGVDTAGVEVRQGEKSFFWRGRYHADLNTRTTLQTDLNVLATFDPKLPAHYRRPEYVMLGNLVPDIQRDVLNQLERKPKLVAMDTMNYWLDSARDSVLKTLEMVDLLTVNDEEARLLSGEYSLRKAARAIRQMGPQYLVIKKGEHGSLLFGPEGIYVAPALPLEDVFDPTGAGDTFAGGMMGYIARRGEVSFGAIKAGILYGSTLASFCVEEFGISRLLRLEKAEVEARAAELHSLVHVVLD